MSSKTEWMEAPLNLGRDWGPEAIGHPVSGTLVGWKDRFPEVDFPGRLPGPLPLARSVVPFRELKVGMEVAVWWQEGDPARPIIAGILQAPSDPRTETPTVLRLLAGERLILECGKASLIMDKDGRITLRGVDLVSRASRTNKIKGGTVLLN